ncbi:MAG: branched-chain amino acid ABC transporter permease [Desulfatirhabdiaceae bacterium]
MELITILLPQLLHGLVWGMAIALIALGLTIVFGMLDVVNFAHGELYMLGAYFGYVIIQVSHNFWLALCISVVGMGVIGIIIEVILFRPLYGRDSSFHLLLTFGLGIIFREIARLVWGGNTLRVDMPISTTVNFLDMTYPLYRLFILGISILFIGAIIYIFNKTEIGSTIKAAAYDRQMASSLGIDVRKLYTIVFCAGAALAALSGVLMSPIYFVYPTMGIDAILRAFIVVIVGGMGSVLGAVAASILIAEVESLLSLIISPTMAETMVFGVLIASMILKPDGLFSKTGKREG